MSYKLLVSQYVHGNKGLGLRERVRFRVEFRIRVI